MTRLMGDNMSSAERPWPWIVVALLRKFSNRFILSDIDIYFHRCECMLCQSKVTLINTASKAYDQCVQICAEKQWKCYDAEN